MSVKDHQDHQTPDFYRSFFPLEDSELFHIRAMLAEGIRIKAAGVSMWYQAEDDTYFRVTFQIVAPGLNAYEDMSEGYFNLMDLLDGMEADAAMEGVQLEQMLYLMLQVPGEKEETIMTFQRVLTDEE